MESVKPRRRVFLPVCIVLLSVCLLLLTPLTHPALQTLLLPPCGHIVLVTAARHGSSWFLNSAESCPSRDSFRELNTASELWNPSHPGPVREIGPLEAGDYAERTHGIKIFPFVYYANRSELVQLFDVLSVRDVPVFVLTRALRDSYRSIKEAVQNKEWNVNHGEKVREDGGAVVDQQDLLRYQDRLSTYFNGVRNLLADRGLKWDEVDYDDVVKQRVIVGSVNQCIIRNCNF